MTRSLMVAVWAFAALSAACLAPAGAFADASFGLCRFEVDADRAAVAEALEETCTSRADEIFSELGVAHALGAAAALVTIRVVADPADIGSASPRGAAPPPWSVAVAYPDARLVVLALRGRDGSPVERLDIELEHELSHIALRDALRGAKVPRWFSEGIAVQQSERSSMARRSSLVLASLGGNVGSLAAIHDYPSGGAAVGLAYAHAADFVGFLLREGGWHGIRVVLNRLRNGDGLDRAFETAYGRTPDELDALWRDRLADGSDWVAVATGSSALWGIATLLFALAYVRSRQRRRRRFDEMGAAEESIDRLVRSAERIEAAGSPEKAEADGAAHALH